MTDCSTTVQLEQSVNSDSDSLISLVVPLVMVDLLMHRRTDGPSVHQFNDDESMKSMKQYIYVVLSQSVHNPLIRFAIHFSSFEFEILPY